MSTQAAKIIEDSLSGKQSVKFIIDSAENFDLLKKIEFHQYEKCIVFCDHNLEKNWWPKLKKVLDESKIPIAGVKYLEAKEETKNLSSYVQLIDYLSKLKCTKSDLVIAVGGGIVLDVIAFLASTYMRGIPLMMIPTTLIGQADASTAGKTCLNTDYSKNLLGTLYLPGFVYNNVNILKTNSPYHQRQGFSEIFKYGLLGSRKLLELLLHYHANPGNELMLDILEETTLVRLSIRKRDPLASNLGHSFGHALEKYSNYSVSHGDAIAVGTLMALEFSLLEGLINASLIHNVYEKMLALKLNTKVNSGIDPGELTDIMLTDKKSSNTNINLVLIKDIGEPLVKNNNSFYPVAPETMLKFLSSFLRDKKYVGENHWEALKENT